MKECPYCKHPMKFSRFIIPIQNLNGYKCDFCSRRSRYSKLSGYVIIGIIGVFALFFSSMNNDTFYHIALCVILVILLALGIYLLCPLYPIESEEKKES